MNFSTFDVTFHDHAHSTVTALFVNTRVYTHSLNGVHANRPEHLCSGLFVFATFSFGRVVVVARLPQVQRQQHLASGLHCQLSNIQSPVQHPVVPGVHLVRNAADSVRWRFRSRSEITQ